jgi:hypothetical protein
VPRQELGTILLSPHQISIRQQQQEEQKYQVNRNTSFWSADCGGLQDEERKNIWRGKGGKGESYQETSDVHVLEALKRTRKILKMVGSSTTRTIHLFRLTLSLSLYFGPHHKHLSHPTASTPSITQNESRCDAGTKGAFVID